MWPANSDSQYPTNLSLPPATRSDAMEQFYLNQTALSLGYIALKRIRALENSAIRLPSSPLLRHLSHIKILAACVEQVGPEEIIEYEMNQDIARDEAQREPSEAAFAWQASRNQRHGRRREMSDDVADERYRISSRLCDTTKSLTAVNEVHEEADTDSPIDRDIPLKPLLLTQPTCTEADLEDDYSMDELYEEYNSQEDEWETASDLSEDNPSHHSYPITSRRREDDAPPLFSINSEVREEEGVPATPPSIIISRSPPLDITMRHPITHTLNKREQYRKEKEQATSELSCGFVEQIEDVLCNEMQYLSLRGMPGQIHLDNHGPRPVSLYA